MDSDKDFFISSTEISLFFAAYDLDNPGGKNVSSAIAVF
jgi:hypothetical protein